MSDRSFQVTTEQQRERLCAFLGRQAVPMLVQVGPLKKQRSTSQNARWWLLLGKAANVSGHSPEELHEICLCRHFGYTEREVTDLLTGEIETKRVPLKRSSARDTKEFREFMDACEVWLGESLGVWLE